MKHQPTELNGTAINRPTITLCDHEDGTLVETYGDEAKDWAVMVTGELADPIVDDMGVDLVIAHGRLKGWRIVDARS